MDHDNGSDEQAILTRALAIMAKRLGRPCRFAATLDPGVVSVEVILRPPNASDPDGYIGASLSSGPSPGETHERHSDLSDGTFNDATLDRVIADLRTEFKLRREGSDFIS